jgi:hypothetical protein
VGRFSAREMDAACKQLGYRKGNPLTDAQHRRASSVARDRVEEKVPIHPGIPPVRASVHRAFWQGVAETHRRAAKSVEWPVLPVLGPEDNPRNVTPNPSTLPLAPAGRKWSAAAARKRIKKWATQGGRVNWDLYARAFLYRDPQKRDQVSGFKLPIADVIKGRLHAVPHGIEAAAASLEGARGGVDISAAAHARARQWLAAYYRKMGKRPPWPPVGPGTPRR